MTDVDGRYAGGTGPADRRARWTGVGVIALLRWTGIPALLSFYRYIAINAPRVTRAAGCGLLIALAVAQAYLLTTFVEDAAAVAALFGLLAAAAALAAVLVALGRRRGWALGSTVGAAALAAYILSRTSGLLGASFIGRWDHPVGTVSMALAALFVALHVTVVTGLNVTAPDRRTWDD